MAIDAIGIMLCFGGGFFLVNAVDHSLINFKSFVTYAIYLPLILTVFYAAGLYPGIMLAPAEEVKRFSISSFFSFVGIALSITIETDDKWAISIALLLSVPLATILLPSGREIARRFYSKLRWWGVPAVIFCSGDSGDIVLERMYCRPDLGYKPAVIINSRAKESSVDSHGTPLFPPGQKMLDIISALNIKVAIICDYEGDLSKIMSQFRYTIMVSKKQDINYGYTSLKDFGGILGFSATHYLTKKSSLLMKRFIDLLILFLSSFIVVPLVLLVSIIIKLTSKGPVFYGHVRVGQNGKSFKCWKFRSMIVDADKQLEKILKENPAMREEWEKDRKFTNDPRVTPIGKFLRRTSIDEIPQLFNILIGEMSFVGPRPVTAPELVKYGKMADYVLSVKPGLSGMWQISGRSDTIYEERITLDTYYIQNWSVWLDIWIIIRTIWVVLKGKGAY